MIGSPGKHMGQEREKEIRPRKNINGKRRKERPKKGPKTHKFQNTYSRGVHMGHQKLRSLAYVLN